MQPVNNKLCSPSLNSHGPGASLARCCGQTQPSCKAWRFFCCRPLPLIRAAGLQPQTRGTPTASPGLDFHLAAPRQHGGQLAAPGEPTGARFGTAAWCYCWDARYQRQPCCHCYWYFCAQLFKWVYLNAVLIPSSACLSIVLEHHLFCIYWKSARTGLYHQKEAKHLLAMLKASILKPREFIKTYFAFKRPDFINKQSIKQCEELSLVTQGTQAFPSTVIQL